MILNLQNTDDFLLNEDFNEYVLKNSSASKKEWSKFFKDNPDLLPEAEKAKRIINGLSSLKDVLADDEINDFQLHKKFEDTWKKFRDKRSKTTFLAASKWLWRSVAVAAVIVFAVTFYAVINNIIQKNTGQVVLSEIYVPAAKQSKLTLPDGTVVWINSDSKIKYSNQFNVKERKVFLEGEAYFEVTHNPKLPFSVLAMGTEVKALGTKFNVKAYSNENKVETVLMEGRVEFSRTDSDKKRTLVMEPGDKVIYNLDDKKVAVTREDIDSDLAWKDGKVIFRNTPLSEVCATLQRWYNAEIILADDTGELLSHPFTFTVEGETLQQVLEYLCQAAPLDFKTEYIDKDGEKGIEKIKYTIQSKRKK